MQLDNNLSLDRCPHCGISKPNLPHSWSTLTTNHSGRNRRNWKVYQCTGCGGLIIACASEKSPEITNIYPNKVSEIFDF